jgi:hypothetical protein
MLSDAAFNLKIFTVLNIEGIPNARRIPTIETVSAASIIVKPAAFDRLNEPEIRVIEPLFLIDFLSIHRLLFVKKASQEESCFSQLSHFSKKFFGPDCLKREKHRAPTKAAI